MRGGTAEIKIYHRALETIREELTSFDPAGDDPNYDREQACEEIMKIIGIVIGDEVVQDNRTEVLEQLVREWQKFGECVGEARTDCKSVGFLMEQTAQLLGEESTK